MDIKEFIKQEVLKKHQIELLEAEKSIISEKLRLVKEASNNPGEEKVYESNIYENLKKDIEEVVKNLAEACNKLESAALKQDSHMKTIPEIAARLEEGKRNKQVILDIFKEVKRAKITAERKLYEMR